MKLHLGLLVVAVIAVFANTLDNSLQLDDAYRVAANPEVERFWPPWRHFTDPRTSTSLPQIETYRPLLPLSLSLGNAVADGLGIDRLTVYHLGNIALHLATCLLLYLLFCELLIHRSGLDRPRGQLRSAAFAGALLFAIHPISGVPVNYISGRDLLMMLLFVSASLLVYVRMRRLGDSIGGWVAALGLFGLSLLAKQNAVLLPLLVLLFEIGPGGRSPRSLRRWLGAAGYAGVVAGFFVWTEGVLGFSDVTMVTGPELSPWLYALTMARLHLFHYLRNAVWPFRIRPQPEIEPAAALLDPGVLAGIAFVVLTLALAWRLRRTAPLVSWSIAGYWLLFAPTSSIWPFYDLAVDYRQYPSLAFLMLALAAGLAALSPGRRLALAAVGAVALYLGVSTIYLNPVWRTEESFWRQSVRYGASPLGHMNYARSVQARDPELAERHYRLALESSPDHVYARINLGMLYLETGRTEEGLSELRSTVERAPEWAIAHHWLGRGLRRVGAMEEAYAASRRAADLDPRNLEYQYQAGYDLYLQQQPAASLVYLERVVARDPDYELSLFLAALAQQQLGRWDEAEAGYRRFLERRPGYAQAWFNLAHGLMEEGRHEEAVAGFEEALRLEPEAQRAAHHWLSVSLAALGRQEEADRHAALYLGETP